MDLKRIRNFCIIAHIDHGKSTLADRLIEETGTLEKREMKHEQILDTMDLEQERGITIKLQPIRMEWAYTGDNAKFNIVSGGANCSNGKADSKPGKYILNLIDTPGHVDFQYEVSRSLASVEGAILIVDATQGIEAQTLSNTYMALKHDLAIVPVLNKIDLPFAEVERRKAEMVAAIGVKEEDIICVSAKLGTNVEKVLQAIVERIPSPKEEIDGKALSDEGECKALIFDSVYDSYKGVVAYSRVMNGSVKRGDKLTMLSSKEEIDIIEVGHFRLKYVPADMLHAGEIGYIVTGLKEVSGARVGDTLWQKGFTSMEVAQAKMLPGFEIVKPYVFASIFCSEGDDYADLRESLEKLKLNDSSLSYEPEQSNALGNGFRCGFLGLLHLDIVQERLEREYNLDLVVTAPSVSYIVVQQNGNEILVSNPSKYPEPATVQFLKEPWVKVEILTPKEYVGGVMKLCQDKRGINTNMQFLDQARVILTFELPLASIVVDFYDNLKSISSGYASMNYEHLEFRSSDLVKLDMLIGGRVVDAFSTIVHRSESVHVGRGMALKLKKLIPRSQFEIIIQAAIGGKIVARESISPYRKDVTGYLYGGDRSRKDKLLKKQKRGKKRMKMVGQVNIPQEAFMAVLQKEE